VLACAVTAAATILVTWPQTRLISTAFAAHVDAYFSTWRLMWTAHALATSPSHLFDANIFHPQPATLAYSDATLLQALIAAPFILAGVSPVLVYNALLLLGFAASGLAMYVLARRVTDSTLPAIAAALVFTMAPYRIEHFMHLELQWTMWMPLTWWAILRTCDSRAWRDGLLAGAFVWLQFVSSIYYGVFLSMTVAVFIALLLVRSPGTTIRALPALAVGGVLAAALTLPYALPYVGNARTLGGRNVEEVLRYSARPVSYLASPGENWLWGWTADRWGGPELRAFPGLTVLLLAVLGLRQVRDAWIFLALALVAFDLSLGLNGLSYRWLFDHVGGLSGLRAPARFAILVQCALAVLAALGTATVLRWCATRRRLATAGPIVLVAAIGVEFLNGPMHLTPVAAPDPSTPDVYRMIRTLGPGVVIELPMPKLSSLPGHEPEYAFWSAAHWNRLVNGYSGYYPPVYLETVNRMQTFPDTASVQRLQRLDVRYIVVHHAFYEEAERQRLLSAMANHPSLERLGSFRDPVGAASLYALRR